MLVIKGIRAITESNRSPNKKHNDAEKFFQKFDSLAQYDIEFISSLTLNSSCFIRDMFEMVDKPI